MKKFLVTISAVSLVFVGIFVYKTYFATPFVPVYDMGEVTIKEKVFSVEISDTSRLRTLGLSGHSVLKDNEGMIFIFPKSDKHIFWMKDMLFPIDIIWIDENFKIVHIEKRVSPETYPETFSPESPSLYVLEVMVGEAEKLDLKAGDEVKFYRKNF